MFMHSKWFGNKTTPLHRGARIAAMVLFGIAAAAVFGLVFGYLVMILWNWLMPQIFNLPVITYWQAFGIVILAKLIFGAFGHGKNRDDHPFRNEKHEFSPFARRENMKDAWKNHRDFHEFWESEGEAAFDAFKRRRKEPETAGDE